MPTKGKCQSCGEFAYLTLTLLENKKTGSLHCAMVCDLCRRFYETGVIGNADGKDTVSG